jgi:pimeloyl-ACP methyl ester carboxylesterase
VAFRSLPVDDVEIAYREAGDPTNPAVILLHGFPSSSHQYRDLVPALADRFHVIAPDYPGFGLSGRPDPDQWGYTFARLADVTRRFLTLKGVARYGLFMQDYGGPVGYRLAQRYPDAVEWMIVQNTNAYEEGLSSAWEGFRALWRERTPQTEQPLRSLLTLEPIRDLFYLAGTRHPERISPDAWESDLAFLQRPHAVRINLDLFYDYRTNLVEYPRWQEFFRRCRPPTQIFWGQGDPFFTPAGGESYLRDLPEAEMHRLDTGHFALEDHLEYIAGHMKRFYAERVAAR